MRVHVARLTVHRPPLLVERVPPLLSFSSISSLPFTPSYPVPPFPSSDLQSSPFLFVALAFSLSLPLARAYIRARAPSDFFPVFTHRSFFPFRNIIGGTMHLSPFPSPPSGPVLPPHARAAASSGEDRANSLAHSAGPDFGECAGRVPATR